jgi:hypothetical protein
MKKLIAVVALCAVTFENADASIEVNLTDSGAVTIYTAENAGESDIASFWLNVTLFALDGDAYIPTIGTLAFDTDWQGADPFITSSLMSLMSTADSSGGYFQILEGDQEQFTVSVTVSVSQDTIARLQISGLNWTDDQGGQLTTLNGFEPALETDALFINTEIVPEPGTFVMMTIGGLLSLVAIRRREVL